MDGDVGEVNPELLKKVANTTAADWKEERKQAIRARILANKPGEPKPTESAAKYLPRYTNDHEGLGGKRTRDGASSGAAPETSSTGSSFSPAAANAVRNLVAQAGFSSTPGAAPTKPTTAASAGTSTTAQQQTVRPVGRPVEIVPEVTLKQKLLKRIQEMKVAADVKIA